MERGPTRNGPGSAGRPAGGAGSRSGRPGGPGHPRGAGRGGSGRPHGPGRGPGRPGHRTFTPRPSNLSPEDRARATDVAKRSGIPFPRAVMVIRGEETVDHVLKDLFIKQRRDRFVREGLDASLAGQVANGRLELDRAKRIQTLWRAQNASFHSDGLSSLEGAPITLALFGHGLQVGRLAHVGRYDVTLEVGDPATAATYKKHDIKFYCRAESVEALQAALGEDPDTAALHLGPSTVLAERWRPDEDLALRWAAARPTVRFRFRDGQTLAGTPLRVALYEVEIACGAAKVIVLTHALVKDAPFDL